MCRKVSKWLDHVLKQPIPQEVAAFCFNLYDDGNGRWSMELIGAGRFDMDDPDWPCYEITDLGTREHPFVWNSHSKWDAVLEETRAALTEYLKNGKYADTLKSRYGIGVGFVDGDIETLYP